MTRNSLTWRLTLLLHGVVVVLVGAFAASALLLTKQNLAREERIVLEETARETAASVDREYVEEKDLARAVTGALEEQPLAGILIEVLDPQGRRLAVTGPAMSSPDGPSTSRSAGSATARSTGSDRARAVGSAAARSFGSTQSRWRTATATAACGVVVIASTSSRAQAATLAALARALALAALPLLLIAFIVSRLLIRRAVRPLAEVGRRAREAVVDQGVRTMGPPFGLAEIDALIESFDRLLARLDDLLLSERRFTHSASHELNTPLTVLSGELEMLLGQSDLPPEARARIERLAGEVASMQELVEALLLLRLATPFAGRGHDVFEPVNLADIAREVVGAATEHHPDRRDDLVLIAPDEVLVAGQPALLASAVRNLVDNACKFTSPGTPIRIAVEDASPARVAVDDGGSGIPIAERERIFDPFYRGGDVREETRGFGLGLPILRHVARAHGGEVLLEESSLGGARFILQLPAWSTSR